MVLFRFPAFFMRYLTESFRPFCIFVPMLEKNEIIQSALQNLKIESLNPMQEAALEQGTGRKDVILLSPTGSGKTLAYLLPLLLTLKPNDDSVQVLILVPSRELALQIDTVFRSMGTSWKTCCCYGGHPIAEEKKSIAGNHPAIIIGTPGRITDHLSKGNFDPETIETLIIDEFDKSLEFGFHDEMAEIITQLPGLKKRMLLSATDAEEIPQFTGLNRTVKLDFLPEATEEQENRLKLMKVLSPSKDKIATLYNLLCTLGSSSSIVFCNHRDAVDRVHKLLEDKKLSAERFHGGMEQPDRERALYKFRNGSCHVLISTDLAARGLDIPEIEHIIHYHLPVNEEAFTHRNGRTARWDATVFQLSTPLKSLLAYFCKLWIFWKNATFKLYTVTKGTRSNRRYRIWQSNACQRTAPHKGINSNFSDGSIKLNATNARRCKCIGWDGKYANRNRNRSIQRRTFIKCLWLNSSQICW